MKQFDSINVIPFIDIILVLLTIVLMTATFVAQGQIEVKLPETERVAIKQDQDPLRITIDREGLIYIDETEVESTALKGRLESVDKDRPIHLRVDAQSPFDHFAQVAALAQTLNLHNLAVVTENSR